MAKDYYGTLGVDKNAGADEIKKAYRTLAKKYHPDLNKEPGAEQKFKDINEAYEILSDENKRAQYDQFGDAAFNGGAGAGGFNGDFGGFSGFGDIFDMFMDKKISAATFQNFIIDMWIMMFKENKYDELGDKLIINVFERLPHDAVYCFAREQVGKSMTEYEFQTIVDKYDDLVDALDIPVYENCNLKRVTNDSQISDTIIKILNIILGDLKCDVETTRVIGLMISEDKYKQRIQQRGRESEEKYEDTTLSHYDEYYKMLYSEIEANSILEATDLRRTSSATL